MIRWHLDIAIVKNRVIGRVYQLPSPDDDPKGGIRPSPPWQAYGMLVDWEDTDLGQHASRGEAKAAVYEWFKLQKV